MTNETKFQPLTADRATIVAMARRSIRDHLSDVAGALGRHASGDNGAIAAAHAVLDRADGWANDAD